MYLNSCIGGFLCGTAGKELACHVGDLGSIPGLGRSLGEGKGYSLQHSGLENSIDCIVPGVAKSRTQPSDFHSLIVEPFPKPKGRNGLEMEQPKYARQVGETMKALMEYSNQMMTASTNPGLHPVQPGDWVNVNTGKTCSRKPTHS